MLKEAKRLYDMGFAPHWLRPNSKAPLLSNWTRTQRESFAQLCGSFNDSYGLGVKLGEASKLTCGGYLANIDVDIKSKDPKHLKEVISFLNETFPGLIKTAPIVKTGYGFRLFIRTKTPIQSGKLTQSSEKCKVLMPNSEISEAQKRSGLTAKELQDGYRSRPAWEIELMSIGRQVVLPPTIHPDTKKPYTWQRPIYNAEDIPLIAIDELSEVTGKKKGPKEGAVSVEFVDVDLVFSTTLPTDIINMIIDGDGVSDRSASCQRAANAMVRHGFSDAQILSVLTDREYYLGETAYDHRKTDSREYAAQWVRDYCLKPAKDLISARGVFSGVAIEENKTLSDEEAATQFAELCPPLPWQMRLTRGGKDGNGPVKPTFENVLLILRNVRGSGLFLKDLFTGREFYGKDAPWVDGRKGKAITDSDFINIKTWLVGKFKIEPPINTIYEAVTSISNKHAFHPIVDELEALPEWDGKKRLDTWLRDHFSAEGPKYYLSQVFRKWMVAAVTRVYEPGTKFDWLPIFEGKQGEGKSVFGEILFGKRYTLDRLSNLGDKEAAAELEGIRCVEFAELDQLKRNELETVKAFITRCIDKYRPAYGRKVIEQPRQLVFYGTTNKKEYLKDETGNRRFVPVKVGRLDFDALYEQKDQLWAEALYIYKNWLEKTLYLEGKAQDHLETVHKEKMVFNESDVMLDLLKLFVEKERVKPANEQFPFHRFKLLDLFNEMNGPWAKYPPHNWNLQQASRALWALHAGNATPLISHTTVKGTKYWRLNVDEWSPK